MSCTTIQEDIINMVLSNSDKEKIQSASVDKNQSEQNFKPTSKIFESFNTPPPNANVLPEGSGQNTAGALGREEVPSLYGALKTVRLEDFKQVHMYPCAKDSLIVGIASAFGMGGIRAVFGASIPKAANWAVGTFVITAIASYEVCQAKRSFEKNQMKKIVEVMDQKKAEMTAKEAALNEKRLDSRKIIDNGSQKSTYISWGNWKFW